MSNKMTRLTWRWMEGKEGNNVVAANGVSGDSAAGNACCGRQLVQLHITLIVKTIGVK